MHCGDFVAPFALLPFRQLSCKSFHAVYGNNDGEKAGLEKLAGANGWQLGHQPKEVEICGKLIAMIHEPDAVDELLSRNKFDAILFGHTHKITAQKVGKTLLLNPGEGCGYLGGKGTVAILDLQSMDVEFHRIGHALPSVF